MRSKPVELVVANAKLSGSPGAYTAVIKHQSTSLAQEFTPTEAESRLKLDGLPAKFFDIMAIELYQAILKGSRTLRSVGADTPYDGLRT
jgi:hypothetical protein